MRIICIRKRVLLLAFGSLLFILGFIFLSIYLLKSKSVINSRAVYGGEEVSDSQKWPFMVRIYESYKGRTPDESGFCGGTLIDPYWVLTAAHCLNPTYDQYKVFIGSTDLQVDNEGYEIEQQIPHPKFEVIQLDNGESVDINDIGLIKLKRPANGFKTISLLTSQNGALEGEGKMTVLLGWGRKEGYEHSQILRQGVSSLLSNERANKTDWYNGRVQKSNIVFGYPKGGVSQCTADSGGPYLIWDGDKWIQIGIISWSLKDRHEPVCGAPKKPSVGTRLSFVGEYKGKKIHYFNWIQETIKNNSNYNYSGKGTFVGVALSPSESAEYIRRIWINKELEKDSESY